MSLFLCSWRLKCRGTKNSARIVRLGTDSGHPDCPSVNSLHYAVLWISEESDWFIWFSLIHTLPDRKDSGSSGNCVCCNWQFACHEIICVWRRQKVQKFLLRHSPHLTHLAGSVKWYVELFNKYPHLLLRCRLLKGAAAVSQHDWWLC